ncbi:hypothetical protein BGZ58_011288 [Dissophora ornata]|nr:hypothetical protein BGZ58_011288 [Dissophora ornata]
MDNYRPSKSPDRYHDSFSVRRSRRIDTTGEEEGEGEEEEKFGLDRGGGGDVHINIGSIGLDNGTDFGQDLTSAELLASWLGDSLLPKSSPEKEELRINHPQAPGGTGTNLSQFNFEG